MRYVIAVCLVTGFLVWDGFENDGYYLDQGLRAMNHSLVMARNWVVGVVGT